MSDIETSAAAINANPLTFPYTNWRGEHALRKVLPLRIWFGSTEWHPEPQWFLRALDIDKCEERDFAFSAINRPQPVTDEDDAIGWCETCERLIRDGEPYHAGEDVYLCQQCAPSYSDLLSSPESFRDDEGNPMTALKAGIIVQGIIEAGGGLDDKMVGEILPAHGDIATVVTPETMRRAMGLEPPAAPEPEAYPAFGQEPVFDRPAILPPKGGDDNG